LGDSDNIAANLLSYVQGFSAEVRDIFEKFEFHNQIEKLARASRECRETFLMSCAAENPNRRLRRRTRQEPHPSMPARTSGCPFQLRKNASRSALI